MIQCYSCNEWKPGDVAPFAICEECKAGAASQPVKEQKSFIDMEKPKRTEYVVIVREIEANQDEGQCQQMVGNGLCNLTASWNCAVCGHWTCDLHEDKEQNFESNSICENCGKLSKANQETVFEFREKLNHG